jgi:hypothetical protein
LLIRAVKFKDMKTGDERTESKGTEAALAILREALRQVSDWKFAKINRYAMRAGKNGGALYQIVGSKILSKELQAKILNKLLSSVLGDDIDFGLSATLRKSVANLPVSVSIDSSQAIAVSAAKEILESTAKAGLMCALVDGVIGSVEAGYLVSRGKMNKKDAFRRVIKEASSGAISGVAGIGAVGMLTALSPIPVVGQMAVLTGVSIGVKRLWNKRRV